MPPTPYPGARAIRFDDGVALDCSHRLDELAERLEALIRIDRDHIGACTAAWRGSSRTWFDQSNEEALAHLRRAATQARLAAADMRANVTTATRLQVDINEQARRYDLVQQARLEALAAAADRS
ncbi:MAG: hypothetical protein KDB02_13790 [Acidimicrobiales bacterium]|nr:hypothetical protein [Acidimicrobiales bacterium]